jgi:presequence protease
MTSHPLYLTKTHDQYRDFIVTKALPLPELNCFFRELAHKPSGAQIIHIECDDPENLFCLSFKTLPSNSNGVAHILEHTVLCGSRKFPVKDSFFAMTRRSLNTFMNALTGSDFTCYPAASQVEKDFYNLLEVYIDAVFHPELKRASFLQEGHRLEFAREKDPKSPLEFKGVVFNEMKGSLASGDTRLLHAMMEALCPDLPYAYNAGGDPKEIPNLKYEELLSFHETYYHPSQCLFFFYGNLPLKNHLDFISEHALKNVPKRTTTICVPKQQRFSERVSKQLVYPIGELEDPREKTMVAFGWLTTPLADQKDLLALTILDSILMDTDVSLLRLPLLQSGLCSQVGAFMDSEMSEVPYLVICKGCEQEGAERLQEILFSTLNEIIHTGIPFHLVEAAIHQQELDRTEITGDHAPFGLTLFMRSALAKQHGAPPENALMVHSLFEELLLAVKDPTYLPTILKTYLLDNNHFVRLTLIPDPKLASKELLAERTRLTEIQERLTEQEITTILDDTEMLHRYQEATKHQSLDCLPKVSIDDVPLLVRDFRLEEEAMGSLKIFHHDCFTNHMLYADLSFELAAISLEDLPYLQLMIAFMGEVGVGSRDYRANLEYIQAHTGGINAFVSLHTQASDSHKMRPSITLHGKALGRKADKLLTLFTEMSTTVRFDERKRIEELVQQLNTSLQNKLSRNALRYAIQHALSGFSTASHISEKWNGLTYYQSVLKIKRDLETNLTGLIDKLNSLKEHLLGIKEPHLILSCDRSLYKTLHHNSFFGLTHLPEKKFSPWRPDYPLSPVPSQARAIASPVAFTCKAFKTVPYIHPHASALSAATQIMENKTLHPQVRERGGAYGVGAHYAPMLGYFYFHAYRDPHIVQTLNSFDLAIEEVARGHFDSQDLEEAKLGIIQQADVPLFPAGRATLAYNWWREGKTKEMRQEHRDRLLALTPREVQRAVEVELLSQKGSGVVVTLAGETLIEQENALLSRQGSSLPVFPIEKNKS